MSQFGYECRMPLVHSMSREFTFEDADTTMSMGFLPEKARVGRAYVAIQTAFNSGTSDLVDIGDSDPDEFLDAQSVASIGIAEDRTTLDGSIVLQDAEREVFVTYTSNGAAPTAGSAVAIVEYTTRFE